MSNQVNQNGPWEEIYQKELKRLLSPEQRRVETLAYKGELLDARQPCVCGGRLWPNRKDARVCKTMELAVEKRLRSNAMASAGKIWQERLTTVKANDPI